MLSPLNSLQHYKKHFPLLASLLISAPVMFFQAIRYSFPLGYAGMFTLVAEEISQANWRLPLTIPHYGPGGIPLVYPPLAMYLFALAIKLGFSTWLYLKFMPAFLSLLAVIPLYYFTRELLESELAGIFAVFLIITEPAVYYTHVWSAGVVRALALDLCLTGLLFYLRCLRDFSWSRFFFAGICFGLLLMTHLMYVLFAALVGLACLLVEWQPARLRFALGILLAALIVAAPWLITLTIRHELSTVLLAASSHRNTDFLVSLHGLIQFIGYNLQSVLGNWFLTALAFTGFLLLCYRKKFQLPLAFVLILFMGEASFFSEILAGMLAGFFSAEVFRWTRQVIDLKNFQITNLLKWLPALAVIICLLVSVSNGLSEIIQYHPEINGASLQMAAFVKQNTRPDETYLFVGTINEAEWFPYLFDRTPVFAMWGSEWKGTYAQQLDILIALRECQLQKSWSCIEAIQQRAAVSPAFLVIPNKRWLVQEVKESRTWERIYLDEFYLVWKRKN